MSPEAQRRGASALAGASPRQKSRTVSRNLSFHSAQPGGTPPIIRGVVEALERQGRAELVAFGSMIVHDVENDFETGLVKARHHLLEFAQGLLALVSIARVGREKPD